MAQPNQFDLLPDQSLAIRRAAILVHRIDRQRDVVPSRREHRVWERVEPSDVLLLEVGGRE